MKSIKKLLIVIVVGIFIVPFLAEGDPDNFIVALVA